MDTSNITPKGEEVKGGEPNQTGDGPRREFASEAVWKEHVKAEFYSALDSLLLRFGAEFDVQIDGDACAYIDAALSEYVTQGGEPRYFYCALDLGRTYIPPRAAEGR